MSVWTDTPSVGLFFVGVLLYGAVIGSVVCCFDFKEALGMEAYGACLGCFFADDDIAAVTAYPYGVAFA